MDHAKPRRGLMRRSVASPPPAMAVTGTLTPQNAVSSAVSRGRLQRLAGVDHVDGISTASSPLSASVAQVGPGGGGGEVAQSDIAPPLQRLMEGRLLQMRCLHELEAESAPDASVGRKRIRGSGSSSSSLHDGGCGAGGGRGAGRRRCKCGRVEEGDNTYVRILTGELPAVTCAGSPSPLKLLEERHLDTPWQAVVCCQLLNKTAKDQVRGSA